MEPIRKLPVMIGEIFGWAGAVLFLCLVSALGLEEYGFAVFVGAIIGVLLFVKLGSDTKNDPAQGLFYCQICKSYTKVKKAEN